MILDTQNMTVLGGGISSNQTRYALHSERGDVIMASFTSLIDLIYPTGAIWLSGNSTSPVTSLGGGTWGKQTGGLLACAGSTNVASVGKTGGSNTITVNQMPSHNHLSGLKNSWIAYWGTSVGTVALANGSKGQWGCCGANDTTGSTTITATGGGAAFVPAHYAVNVWQRTS